MQIRILLIATTALVGAHAAIISSGGPGVRDNEARGIPQYTKERLKADIVKAHTECVQKALDNYDNAYEKKLGQIISEHPVGLPDWQHDHKDEIKTLQKDLDADLKKCDDTHKAR
ncbi:Uu.00g088530.m01.CDS01 [Anthostomella pinea]|uniref:Uu.00g088530.m01.CDS01 n=1 Tax=Anthostomella pinea TaxID=933095 RepID=A0AAI8YK45_9PEZI|nr:Uu.00g088530.m01.CDS01 [Anthostomella pinea]